MAVKPPSDESEGYRLRKEYERANERYTWAVHELNSQAQSVPHEDFEKLAKYVREARAETADALRDLKLFESEHPKNIHDLLRQEHQEAIQSFRDSIRDLVVLVDNSAPDSDLDLAHLRISAARRTCEVARAALEHHRAEHGR